MDMRLLEVLQKAASMFNADTSSKTFSRKAYENVILSASSIAGRGFRMVRDPGHRIDLPEALRHSNRVWLHRAKRGFLKDKVKQDV